MKLARYGVTLVTAVLVSAAAPRVYAQVRFAVVDLQRALNETEDGRQAKAQLKRLFKQRQDGLDKQQDDLKKMKESIEKQKNVLSREALQKQLETYQSTFVELQSTYVENQRELATKESDLTKRILARMERILRRIGQTDGYALILERNEAGVMWVPGNLDVTDAVIQRYNAGEGREGDEAAGGVSTGGSRSGAGGTAKTKNPNKRH